MQKHYSSSQISWILLAGAVAGASLAYWQQSTNHFGPTAAYAQQTKTAEVARENLNTDAIASADQLSGAFREVAKSLRPAVVSVQSVREAKTGASRRQGRRQGVPQLPPEFKEFFGGNSPFGMPMPFDDGEGGDSDVAPDAAPKQVPSGLGSGVIVSPNGYILTNNHVVDGASKLEVVLSDDRKFEAKVVGTDPKIDIAVIKIEASGLLPAKLGNSEGMQVGDWVIAIGSPFGLSQTVTTGIISSTHREDVGITQYDDFLQTDAAINPGNSGGPLLNLRGEVIGINTAIASSGGGFNGIGFAIPSNVADKTLQSILRDGKVTRGFLGIEMGELSLQRIEELNLPKETKGVFVNAVSRGGPAEKAGLKPGDVIVSVAGKPIVSSNTLRRLIANTAPSTSLEFNIIREGSAKSLNVEIDEQTDEKLAMMSGQSGTQALGITVEELTAEVAKDIGIESGETGVVVKEIDRKSELAKLIRPGEVILEVNRTKVSTPDEFMAAIGKSKGVIRLLIRNASSTRIVSINR